MTWADSGVPGVGNSIYSISADIHPVFFCRLPTATKAMPTLFNVYIHTYFPISVSVRRGYSEVQPTAGLYGGISARKRARHVGIGQTPGMQGLDKYLCEFEAKLIFSQHPSLMSDNEHFTQFGHDLSRLLMLSDLECVSPQDPSIALKQWELKTSTSNFAL